MMKETQRFYVVGKYNGMKFILNVDVLKLLSRNQVILKRVGFLGGIGTRKYADFTAIC